MKSLILLAVIIPAFSLTMENTKPTISINNEEFFSLLDKHDNITKNFSHEIRIPTEGAYFKLECQALHPHSIELDIEKGTNHITLSSPRFSEEFFIANDSNKELAKLIILSNPK